MKRFRLIVERVVEGNKTPRNGTSNPEQRHLSSFYSQIQIAGGFQLGLLEYPPTDPKLGVHISSKTEPAII